MKRDQNIISTDPPYELTFTPSRWTRFRLWLSLKRDLVICFFRGHKWKTQGGAIWTDYGWEYDAYTECSRCGMPEGWKYEYRTIPAMLGTVKRWFLNRTDGRGT